MIVGIGVDIVEVSRVEKLLQKYNDRFLNKLFSGDERKQKSKWNASDVAKRFSAKEAVVKALGCGFLQGVTMPQILVNHNSLGKPEVILSGVALKRLIELEVNNIQLSISDEKQNAISYCILEKTNEI